MKTKLSGKFWLTLILFSLIGQVAWVVENMYLNVFIYKMFNASASDISAMVAASAVAATVTTIFIGALSDKVGKRKIFMCSGYILWGISIFSFTLLKTEVISSVFPLVTSAAAVGTSLTIILDCVMTFFGSTANDAAFNAWLTDSTDNTNRGAAEGVNSMMPLVAMLAVFGGFMFLDLDNSQSWSVIFTVIGCVVTLIGIIGIFIIKDPQITPSETGYLKNVVYGFLPSVIRKNLSLYFTFICFIIFNVAIQIFMPYLIIYYEVSLGMADYVFIMAPAVIIASVVTVFWGRVYDKKGYALSSVIGLLWLALGCITLFIFKNKVAVFIGSLLMMCGFLGTAAVFGAKIRDLTPCGEAGRFQSIRIVSQVLIPGVVGPYIGKLVLKNADTIVNNDGTTSFVPNENIFLASLITCVVLLIILAIQLRKKKPQFRELTTRFEEFSNISWESEHPSPQFKRDTYISLCGEWDLSVLKKSENAYLGKIKVPFPPESRISGISRTLQKGEKYVYERDFTLIDEFKGKNVILHFGAVDLKASVFVNGSHVCDEISGYIPFKVDITPYLKDGENTLRVIVTDETDTRYLYGKQKKKRGGMWYTPVSGIWQSVWLEGVCSNHIENIRITPDKDNVKITVKGGENQKKIILDNGEEYEFCGEGVRISINNPVYWTPETPHLYYFTVISGEDRVESYFALRNISVEYKNDIPCMCLNDKPYFFNGLLDQGYYSDGIYTPSSPEGYIYDITLAKNMGFNMLRKHIKIEPELFYYYCDKLGIVVFQDMVNCGKYSFLLDTALPTLGIKRGLSRPASKQRRAYFEGTVKATQDILYNHPSVCYYTIFNEGWGQHNANKLYKACKEYDPSRIYDTASGWFKVPQSDVESEHVYFKKINLKTNGKKPLVLSEFGGYSYKIAEHSFNMGKNYGYRTCETKESFTSDMEELYRVQIATAIENGLCAAVLTQISDVEDETNGLVTYNRHVIKIDTEKMMDINREISDIFNKKHNI